MLLDLVGEPVVRLHDLVEDLGRRRRVLALVLVDQDQVLGHLVPSGPDPPIGPTSLRHARPARIDSAADTNSRPAAEPFYRLDRARAAGRDTPGRIAQACDAVERVAETSGT